MRDYQRAKVYAWENYIYKKYSFPRKSLATMKRLATFACKFLNIKKVNVKIDPRLSVYAGQYNTKIRTIELDKNWIYSLIVLHELVHSIVGPHNNKFVTYLCKLLNRYCNIPKKELRQSLIKYKVDFMEF